MNDFPIENLPYGVFSVDRGRRVGVAVGDQILDLTGLGLDLFQDASLEPLLAAGSEAWIETRQAIFEILHDPPGGHLVLQSQATMHLPCRIGDYVDFYSSLDHATRVGRILRPEGDPLTANWRHLPIGYHGRAGTIVIDGTPIRRPVGQRGKDDFGPTRRLDFEMEVGFLTGTGPAHPVAAAEAEKYIFGLVLVNDWSARDLQAWEYQPLGPFLGKSFATTISPWVVPLAALAPFRVGPPDQDPAPLSYLAPAGQGIDLKLEVTLNGEVVTRSNLKYLYWTMSQQLAHATSNGATFRAGDLFASGTISGPTDESRACLLEMGGPYLEDGDQVTMTGWASGHDGPRIGFGFCRGQVVG